MNMLEVHHAAAPRRSHGKAVFAKTLPLKTGVFFAGFGWTQSDAPNDQIKTLVGRLDL
jgi:hypothetical protein